MFAIYLLFNIKSELLSRQAPTVYLDTLFFCAKHQRDNTWQKKATKVINANINSAQLFASRQIYESFMIAIIGCKHPV